MEETHNISDAFLMIYRVGGDVGASRRRAAVLCSPRCCSQENGDNVVVVCHPEAEAQFLVMVFGFIGW